MSEINTSHENEEVVNTEHVSTEQVTTEHTTTENDQTHTTEASESHESGGHEVTLAAEPIIHVGHLAITNSMFSSWIVVLFLIILSLVIRKKLNKIPRGIQNAFEMILEGALNLADSVTGSRAKSMKLFPISFAFFMFILFNNWLGLLPGVGTIGFMEGHTFIPFLRGGTADLNTTLAFALVGIIFTHFIGIVTIGAWKHLNKFVGIKLLLEIPKKVIKEPTIIIVNPIKFFVGIVEMIGEIAKIASLSFRLFGNVFAGEVLLVSMAAIFAFVVPIPFMFLEIIVGIIQALIFSMLILVFGTIAMADEH